MRRKPYATNATIWALIAALVNPAVMVPWAYGRDTDIFLGVTSTVATAEPNILIVLDTSDTMNIPEPWREYDLRDASGNQRYDSHIEYLWNDPTYINSISTQAPADNLFSNAGSSPNGYFATWSGTCPSAANPLCPKDSGFFAGATAADRTALKTAALAYAAATESGDPGARSTYRNYSDASWIYWLPTGTAETDSRLWSFAFNRFAGGIRVSNFSSSNGSSTPVVRGGFTYGNAIVDFTQGSAVRNASSVLNRCTASTQELLPSTVYAPTEFPRNDGKWLNQQWMRWERWLNLENSRASAYPGSHATTNVGGTNYRDGYLGASYTGAFPGPTDPAINPPASTPHGVASPPAPTITSSRDNSPGSGTIGTQGQPIRVQDDSGVSGFADDATDSHSGWTELKADLGGYNFQAVVNGMSQATLQALRGVYGYPLLASTGASAVELERFSAWKGNRDVGATAFGMVTGTPAYYNVRTSDPSATSGTTYTCTRACNSLASGSPAASGPVGDGTDGAGTTMRYYTPNGAGQYCDPVGTLSGDCRSITGNPLHPTDPPACTHTGVVNYVDKNHTGCAWTGRSSKFVEGVGTVYYGGTCSGSCRGAGNVLGAANCPSGATSTSYCTPVSSGSSLANGGGANWLGSYTIDGTTYTNVTKNVQGQCSDLADTSQSCVARKGFTCVYSNQSTAAGFCADQTSSSTPASTTTRYPGYNRNASDNNLIHDCKADEPSNNGGTNVFMTNQKRNFDATYNTTISTAGTVAAYTTNSANATSPPAIDLYSVNYLNWKFGAKGPSGAPIGRKTRLQIAKDALADLVAATDGVRFGVMTFNSLPNDTTLRSSQGSQGGKIIFPVKRMGNNAADPDFVNRAAIVNAINNQVAKAASPLTETMSEAYRYFSGRAPRYGTAAAITANFGATALPAVGSGNVTDGADATAVSGGVYVSPMLNNPTTAAPASCQKNFVIMITDGGPEHDVDASDFVPGLQYTTLAGVFATDTRVDTFETDTSSGQFETSGAPYGQQSRFNELRPDGGYVWLDELTYFMAKADMSPGARHSAAEATTDTILGTQSVTTYTIGFAGANSPVVQNAGERSATTGGYRVAEDSAGLAAALTDVLISIRDFSPTVAAPTVPLSALNRAQNDLDVYLAFFAPSTNQAWKGTVKRFRIGQGATECGAADKVCLIGKTVLTSGSKDIEKVEVDTTTGIEQVVVDPESVSFWNPDNVMDGGKPDAGGTGLRLMADPPAITPATRNVYTFITKNPLSPSTSVQLTDATNLVTETNTRLTKTLLGNAAMSDATKSTIVNFIRGGNPGDAACSDAHDPATPTPCTTWRTWSHADVQHSRPIIVTYDSTPVSETETGATRANLQYIFFLTNDGLLHAIDAANGHEKWAFLVEEAMPLLNTAMTSGSGLSLDLADGSPAVWVDRGNANGMIDGSERAWLFFGLRRGGRAYYGLDITNIDLPRFMWKISSDYHPVDHPYYAPLGSTTGTGKLCTGIAACVDTPAFNLLGQTWSTPVVGRVKATNAGARSIDDPVVIFGGGYDTQQDFASIAAPTAPPAPSLPTPLPATSTTGDYIGKALYIVEGSSGAPLKVFSSTASDFLPSSPVISWSIASDLTVINSDLDAQGLLDRIVVGDLGGNLWRFDLPGDSTTAWKGKLLATLSDAGVPNRKILFAPTVVPQKDPFPVRWDAVYVGTGDREHPLVTATSDKIFMVVDFDIGTTATDGPAASFAAGDFLSLGATDTTGVLASALVTKRGWVRDLETGEKVTGSPFVFNQKLRFGTYTPTAITSECLPPGEGRLNEIDALFGGLFDLSGDGVVSARDRYYAGTSRGYFSPMQTVILGGRIYSIGFAGGGTFSTGGGTDPGGGPNACKGKLFRTCLEGEVGVAQRTYWYMEPEQ